MSSDNGMAKPLDSLSDEELFQQWLAVMDDTLEVFTTMLPSEVSRRLDYTPDSLDVLEQWILERYPAYEQIIAESEVLEVDGLARYVGETIRRHTNSEWAIRYDDPKDAYYALPQLRFASNKPPICPRHLVTASVDRRTGRYLSKVARNVIAGDATT